MIDILIQAKKKVGRTRTHAVRTAAPNARDSRVESTDAGPPKTKGSSAAWHAVPLRAHCGAPATAQSPPAAGGDASHLQVQSLSKNNARELRSLVTRSGAPVDPRAPPRGSRRARDRVRGAREERGRDRRLRGRAAVGGVEEEHTLW